MNFIFFFAHPIATNFETIPPTINPNDHANKLARPEINVPKHMLVSEMQDMNLFLIRYFQLA